MLITTRICAIGFGLVALWIFPVNDLDAGSVVATPTEAALQAAINGGGVVTFGFDGTITLASTVNIANNVVLDGTGHSVIISGNQQVGIFAVAPGVTFSATNLILANGNVAGANGANGGAGPYPPGYVLAQSGFPGQGGAIYDNGGTVQLTSCVLSNNTVSGGTGGTGPINTSGGTGAAGGEGDGGAIYVNGGALLLNSVILFSNSAFGSPGGMTQFGGIGGGGNALGGAIYLTNGSVTLANCNLGSNFCKAGVAQAVASGGAIFVESGSLLLTNCVVAANTAAGQSSTIITAPPAPAIANGGGVAAISGNLTLLSCQISSNFAVGGNAYRYSGAGTAQGGGVFSSATVVVSNSTFSGNQAAAGGGSSVGTEGDGGAFCNLGTAMISDCTFFSNVVVGGIAGNFGTPNPNYPGGNGLGGAIYNGSQLSMTNCTVALNLAQGGDGSAYTGLPGSSLGGGIYSTSGTISVMNITVASNSVFKNTGGGSLSNGLTGGANVANSNGTFIVKNTILAYGSTNGNAYGTITDGGFNMSSDGSASLTASGTSLNSTDPKLRSLANYGGPTFTMALATNSPAVGSGTAVGAPPTDQRGYPRPSGSGVDMGAYQLQLGIASPMLALVRSQNLLQLSFQGQSGGAYQIQYSTNLASWTNLQLIGPLGNSAPVNISISNVNPGGFYRVSLP